MEPIDFALPVGWIALGALAAWAVLRLRRDAGLERLTTMLEEHVRAADTGVDRALAAVDERLRTRDERLATVLDERFAALRPDVPAPAEDDAATRLHARRRRVAPELFAAVRDLHRAAGDLVDQLHGWPAGVDPPDLWDAVDTARSRLHAVFARTRIHLPTPVDTLVAEYRRVVTECLKSQRHSEQLADGRPQAARFAADRAAELLRAADEHFRRIEDDLRGMIEAVEDSPAGAPGATPEAEAQAARPGDAPAPAGGIRPSSGPTMTFESDLLGEPGSGRRGSPAHDDDDDEDDDEDAPSSDDRRPANGGPDDTMRPRD